MLLYNFGYKVMTFLYSAFQLNWYPDGSMFHQNDEKSITDWKIEANTAVSELYLVGYG